MFTKDDLGRLLSTNAAPAVSLFLPTHVAGREIRQDPIRLKNLLGSAMDQLTGGGMRRPDAEAMLAAANRLVEDANFWRHQDRGLAVFAGPGGTEHFRVPMALTEEAVVGPAFSLRPLLPLLAADEAFMILALTAGRSRLFSATRNGLAEEEVEGMPTGVQEIHGETDYDENNLHSAPPARHAGRRGSAVSMVKTHNFGEDPEELRHAHLIEYLRRVSAAVDRHLNTFHGPLVLFAEEEIQGQIRAMAAPRALLDDRVVGNPDAVTEEELHSRAYQVVAPRFEQGRLDAVGRFRAMHGDSASAGRTATRMEEVVSAARHARIDTLLVTDGERVWGRYDESADKVTTGNGDDRIDLLEYAVAQTLTQGGTVHVVGRDDLPQGVRAAAILRY